VRNAWAKNFRLARSDKFVDTITQECEHFYNKGALKYVRVHGSGDFFSQEYVDKWKRIAQNVPNVVFYAYTKREDDFDMSGLRALPNFVLHLSDKPSPLNYGSAEFIEKQMEKFGGFLCPHSTDRTGKCGSECVWCMEKENEGTPIWFLQH
jgi:hypothetical protein